MCVGMDNKTWFLFEINIKALGNIKTAIRMLDYSESVGQAVTAY